MPMGSSAPEQTRTQWMLVWNKAISHAARFLPFIKIICNSPCIRFIA